MLLWERAVEFLRSLVHPHGEFYFQVEGVVLPKGTVIMLSLWALHRNPEAWGEDCEEWRHERWLQGPSVEAAKKDKHGNTRWSPFQDGPANCIGWHLAMVRTTIEPLPKRFSDKLTCSCHS